MNKKEKNKRLVEKYLQGGLKGDELIEFENRIKQDRALLEELRLQQMETVADKIILRDAVEEMLQGFENERKSKEKQKKSGLRKVIISLLGLLIVITLILIWYLSRPIPSLNEPANSSPQFIAQNIYQEQLPDQINPNSGYKGPNDSTQKTNTLNNGLKLIREQKIEPAIDSLTSILPDTRSIYFLGHAFFLQKKYNRSIEQFDTLINDDVLGEKAQFFLALSHLANNDISEYKRLAKELENTVYAEVIRNINKDLSAIE